MGYAWNGVCYQDTSSALAAFVRDVPAIDAAGINTFNGSMPTINGTGLITWVISNRPLSGTTATTRNGTTQLPTCSNLDMSQWPVQSITFYVALAILAFIGFKTGYRP